MYTTSIFHVFHRFRQISWNNELTFSGWLMTSFGHMEEWHGVLLKHMFSQSNVACMFEIWELSVPVE